MTEFPSDWTVKRIGVLGPGAIGGLLAVAYEHVGYRVTCICRCESARRIQERGLKLISKRLGSTNSYPEAVESLRDPVDILYVAVKAPDLQDAVARIRTSLDSAVVIPLLNGLEHVEFLREKFGPRIAAGSISVESRYMAPGEIEHVSAHVEISIGRNADVSDSILEKIQASLQTAGIDCRLVDGEAQVLWEKLVRLCPIAATTTVTNKSLGEVLRNREWNSWLKECVYEAVSVARANGCDIDRHSVLTKIESLPSSLKTSMQQDLQAGRKVEVDGILGAVARAGLRYGMRCPRITDLQGRILQMCEERKDR